MGIISLVIQNAWNRSTSPRVLRVTAMASLILLVLTQLLIFLVVIPNMVKIPISLEQSFAQLVAPAGREFVDICMILVSTMTLFVLKYKTAVIILSVLFGAVGVVVIDAFGDEVLEDHKIIALGATIVLGGAVFFLAAIELLAVFAPVLFKN